MDTKIEQLNEGNNEDEYYSGASKKKQKTSFPNSVKIMACITIVSCLITCFLLYKCCMSKKKFSSFKELAESRFSLRTFDQRPVEQEKIDALLRVVQVAPTAENLQPQKIYIITKEEDRQKIKTVTKYHFNAPMFFLVCVDKNNVWKHPTEEYYSTEIDGTISLTHIILEAVDLGLGTTVVRSFETQKMKEAFGLPENMYPIALLPIGYPREGVNIIPKPHYDRKDIKEFAEYL